MRKRIFILVATALLALLAPAAKADFHPACSPDDSILAFTALRTVGTSFEYSGYVECHDASITVSTLTLTPVVPTPGASSGSAAPLECTDVCTSTGTAPAVPGAYEVYMEFTATSGDQTFTTSRVGEWVYSGVGQPGRTCPITGFRAPLNGCL